MVDLKVEELNWAEAQLFGGGVGLCCAACGILVLRPGLNPDPWQ